MIVPLAQLEAAALEQLEHVTLASVTVFGSFARSRTSHAQPAR